MIDPRRLCQLEIQVSDMRRATAFYENAFGWRPVPAELHEYVVLEVPPDCPFGLSLVPGRLPGQPGGGVVIYFTADDPEAVVAQAEAAGGKRRFGPMNLASYGLIWQIEDPDGNRFGLYQRPPPR